MSGHFDQINAFDLGCVFNYLNVWIEKSLFLVEAPNEHHFVTTRPRLSLINMFTAHSPVSCSSFSIKFLVFSICFDLYEIDRRNDLALPLVCIATVEWVGNVGVAVF